MKRRHDSLIVKSSSIRGKGVFANRNFAPHEKVLDWKDKAGRFLYLNHSCQPTCYTREPRHWTWSDDVLFAGPNGLKKGGEATFDYRKTRWTSIWEEEIRLGCGCPKCKETG